MVVIGYRVTDVKRNRKVGVACSSLKELLQKGCEKLNLNEQEVNIHLQDGTIIDDEIYFRTIEKQTLFIFCKKEEQPVTGVDIVYNVLKSVNIDLLRAAEGVKLFFDKDAKSKLNLLHQLCVKEEQDGCGDNSLTNTSHRHQHPDWFKDLETNAQTKEEFMRKRSKGRIEGYFYNTRDQTRKSSVYKDNKNAKDCLEKAFKEFSEKLRKDGHFACYFDRKAEKGSLCNSNGLFKCDGVWNAEKCQHCSFESSTNSTDDVHFINPYTSRQARIIFGTWNLDHRIERSRRIVPCLLEAAELCFAPNAINWDYFYDLLFTTKNLRLVHIVCHDKGQHKQAVCDPKLFLIKKIEEAKINNNEEGKKRDKKKNQFKRRKMATKSDSNYS